MRTARSLSWMSLVLLAALCCLPAARAEELQRELAAVKVGPAAVEWTPAAAYETLVLTVSGPQGFLLRRELAGTIRPSFEPFTEQGEPLPDGLYLWELRAAPILDLEARKALIAARKTGDEATVEKLRAAGELPEVLPAQSGVFTIRGGEILRPHRRESTTGTPQPSKAGAGLRPTTSELSFSERVCIGPGCVDPETFGLDTLKLKENNTRLLFEDNSTAAGFPATDWRLAANDTTSGGANRFSIEDATAATTPFTIVGAAPNNSLFIAGNGRIGMRTAVPTLDLHVVGSNTPGLRLEQNASGGFIPYTWDVAGNDGNFFVRDVTGGFRLPLRIRPGAPTSSVDITATGNVGIGTATADAKLDVEAASAVEVRLTITSGTVWQLLNDASGFGIQRVGAGFRAVNVDAAGNMVVHGTVTQGSSRDLKTGFEPLDAREALARVAALPVSQWTYKADGSGARHIGPTAEDFHEAFGLGRDDKHIAPSDQAGVALLALQGLHQVLREKDREIADLRSRLETLEEMVRSLAREKPEADAEP
jgi:Chaperone of endosialidase